MPPIGVVTVTHNSMSVLPAFFASLGAGAREKPEIVLVDNRSEDWEEARSVAHDAGAQALQMPRNAGYGSAANYGVAQLPEDCELIVIANPDIVVGANALDVLAGVFDEDPAIGAVGPRILNPDGSTYPSARRFPSLMLGAGHALFARVWPSNPWTRRYHNLLPAEHGSDTDWLSGAFIMFRRTAFESVNGFDEEYFMYFEDVDLSWRLASAGWKRTYEPRAIVTHSGAHSTSTVSAQMRKAHHESAIRYVSRRYPGPPRAPLRFLLRLALKARASL